MSRTLSFGHTQDSDDAFLFYALFQGLVDRNGIDFQYDPQDIETLNRRAMEGTYDVTSLSFHAYAYAAEHYVLLSVGASVGDGTGPILVSRRSMTSIDLEECTIGVPGDHTTSYLALRLYCPETRTRVMGGERIAAEVLKGNLDAGLLLHAAHVTEGLRRIADLGEWWRRETGLPLPLGGNAVRRSLDPATQRAVAEILRSSVQYALEHPRETLEHAAEAKGVDRERATRFVGRYVNSYTLELGERGYQAVELLLRLGYEKGIIPKLVRPEFAD